MKIKFLRSTILLASCLFMAAFSACHPDDPPTPGGGGNGGGGNGGDNPTSIPIVIIESIDSPTTSTATVNVSITNTGNGLIHEKGIVYYTSESDSLITLTSDSNENQFSVNMNNLSGELVYFVKAYADNDLGTGYSEIAMFTPGRPYVQIEITEVTKTTISVKTTISNFSGNTISEKGICYGQTQDLTYYSDETIPYQGSENEFYINITDLTPGDRYYIRSYVKINGEFTYSSIVDTLTVYPWHYVTNIPGLPRTQEVSFAIGSKAYIGTGVYQNDMFLEDLWEYDTETGAWTQKANYPEGKVRGLMAFSVNGKGYAGLGYRRDGTNEGEKMDSFYEYDPVMNTWTRKHDYPGGWYGYDSRHATALNNKGYFITAKPVSNNGVNIYEYNPNNDRWTLINSITFGGQWYFGPHTYLTANAVDSDLYIYIRSFNGNGGNDGQVFYQYDMEFNIWIEKSCPIPITYTKMESFVIGNNFYLFSGRLYAYADVLNYTVYKYYPETNTWTDNEVSEPKIFRYNPVNLLIDGKLYYGGGNFNGNQTSLWVYDPSLE